MRHLTTEKGIAQLCHFMMAVRTTGVTQKLALIAVSWMQLLAGNSFSVFSNVDTPLPHLYPMKWLPSIREFLRKNGLSLELSINCIPELQRVHDEFIMDHVVTGIFKRNEIQMINACRIYKGVTLLSDMVTMDGKSIAADMLTNLRPNNTNKGLLPYQNIPNAKAWKLWKKVLLLFCITETELKQPLGAWFL